MASEFMLALTQLCNEKNIPKEVVLSGHRAGTWSPHTSAISAATRILWRTVTRRPAKLTSMPQKKVVEQVIDANKEMTVEEARAYKTAPQLDDLIEIDVTPQNFGRIAAQTAKQVVTQRLREAEREVVYAEYADREAGYRDRHSAAH